jgi:hypothetical protein
MSGAGYMRTGPTTMRSERGLGAGQLVARASGSPSVLTGTAHIGDTETNYLLCGIPNGWWHREEHPDVATCHDCLLAYYRR